MVRVKYQTSQRLFPGNLTHVVYANVSQETLDTNFDGLPSNGQTGADVTVPITISALSNRDSSGLHARGIFVAWEDQPPEGYKMRGRIWIPVLIRNRFERLMLHNGGSYRGARFIIVGKRSEEVRI